MDDIDNIYDSDSSFSTDSFATFASSSGSYSDFREYSMTFLGLDLIGDGVLSYAVNSDGAFEMIRGQDVKSDQFHWFGLAFSGMRAIGNCVIDINYTVTGFNPSGESFKLYGANSVDGVWQFTELATVSNGGQTVGSGGYMGHLRCSVNLDRFYTRLYFYKYFDTKRTLTLGVSDPDYSGSVSLSGSASGKVSDSGSYSSAKISLSGSSSDSLSGNSSLSGSFTSSPFDVGDFVGDLTTFDASNPLWQYYSQYGTVYWKTAGAKIATLKLSRKGGLLTVKGTSSLSGDSSLSGSSTISLSGTRPKGTITSTGTTSDTISESGSVSSSAESRKTYSVAFSAVGLIMASDGIKDSVDNQTSVIQKEQDETQKTIKDETEKQTSKIGGFFDTLLQGIKDFFSALFIPDDIATKQFTDLLEQKLGFIYQVPAIIISFVTTLFKSFSSASASVISFPGWSFNGWTFLEPVSISRSEFSAIFNQIDPILTIVGTILVVFAFCNGVKSFYDKILGESAK